MGFSEQLSEIIRRLPETRQTLLFSATLPKLLVEFARAGKINFTFLILSVRFLHASIVIDEGFKSVFARCLHLHIDVQNLSRTDRTSAHSFGRGF